MLSFLRVALVMVSAHSNETLSKTPVFGPQPVGIAERRQPAVGAHPGTRKNHNLLHRRIDVSRIETTDFRPKNQTFQAKRARSTGTGRNRASHRSENSAATTFRHNSCRHPYCDRTGCDRHLAVTYSILRNAPTGAFSRPVTATEHSGTFPATRAATRAGADRTDSAGSVQALSFYL